MINFLDNADKLMYKTELLPLTCQLPCCCVKFEILFITKAIWLQVCQIILKIMKTCVRV